MLEKESLDPRSIVMLTLGIDSATKKGSVAVVDEGEVLGEFTFSAEMSQSEKLLPTIDLLLRKTDVELVNLDRITVSTGPGSFTGLRIGISTAKGLCHALKVPLVGVPITEAYYDRVGFFPGYVCPVITDRRDLVYYAIFHRGEKIVAERSRPLSQVKDEIKKQTTASDEQFLVLGTGVEIHREELTIEGVKLATGQLNAPSAVEIALIGSGRAPNPEELHSIEPLYAQRPLAERA